MERNICKYYSYSMGRCYAVEIEEDREVVIDVSECPVIKAGFMCSNFRYRGDEFGDIDGKKTVININGGSKIMPSEIDKCYFCGEETVRFHEHYHFCPECSAIYTYLIVQKSHCKHIKDRTPTVMREPWYKDLRMNSKKPYIMEETNGSKTCSICNRPCSSDGW